VIAITRQPVQHAYGFTLVEVMVALVIGMISMLVVLQTFSVSEASKRTTTGGDDAQMAGAVALFTLQRDIRQSGYGISSQGLIGCGVQLRTGLTVKLAPLTIDPSTTLIPAGDANTDTLLVSYGNPNGATEGDGITAQTSTPVYAVQTPTSFVKNDWVIAAPATRPATCNLILDHVSVAAIGASPNVTVSAGVANMTNGSLYNLGQSPTIIGYAVRGGNLTTCSFTDTTKDCTSATTSGNWTPIAGNISSLRAVYGRDTSVPMDDIVDIYDQSTPITACGWLRTSAVSLALVARNSQFDKATLTTSAPSWFGTALTTAVPIDLSGNAGLASGATWQNYRYKLYTTVVPLRNVTWMGVTAGC
jgi:type IV pilus assembly protein PilW